MTRTLPEALETFGTRFAELVHLHDAFSSGERSITFAQTLNLTRRGATLIRRETPASSTFNVGLLAENQSAWLVAYYAATWAGATMVPLDVRQVEEELVDIVSDAGLDLLLASPTFAGFAQRLVEKGLVAKTMVLDEALLEAFAASEPSPPAQVTPSTPATIIYTSGTTGRSKGVVLTHHNVVGHTLENVGAVQADDTTRILAILPLNHIFVFAASLIALASGGTLVFLDSLKPSRVVEALKTQRITHMAGIPLLYDAMLKGILAKAASRGPLVRNAFRIMLKAGWSLSRLGLTGVSRMLFHSVHKEFAPNIRVLVCGGARCRPETIRGFLSMGYNFQEGYGLTETTGGIICNPFHGRKMLGTVGRPFGDTKVRILDPDATGEGEVAIHGLCVFQGYYKNPQATAEVLSPDGWFRTGDLGRVDERGVLSITGRAKELIILPSGKNISPEELEFHYSRSPLLEEAAALGITDETGSEKIHLVLVPTEATRRKYSPLDLEEALRLEVESLSRKLASYKRPHGLTVRLEPLPRTSTRKIRRNELARWLKDGESLLEAASQKSSRPRLTLADQEVMDSPEMAAIVGACATLLDDQLDPTTLAPTSNLFLQMGMDSIMLMEILTLLESELGASIPNEKVGAIQTLGDLYEAVKEAEEGAQSRPRDWKTALRQVTAGVEIPLKGPAKRLAAFIEPLDYGAITLIGKVFYRLRGHNMEFLPPTGPYILAPNHASYFDYPAVVGLLPRSVRREAYSLGKKEVYGNPLGRILSAIHRVIPVDRSGDVLPALESGAKVLKSGKILFMHPEGTRSMDGKVHSLKHGVAILARELGVPVVPVYIRGTYDVYPRGRKLPRLFQLSRMRRYRVEVFFGKPLLPESIPTDPDPYRPILEHIMAFMQSMEQEALPETSRA